MGHRTLGALAEKCHAFAKALHYKELEYHQTPGAAVEALISINNHLRQPEAAIGILTKAQQDLHMELKVHTWFGLLLAQLLRAMACRRLQLGTVADDETCSGSPISNGGHPVAR